MAQYPSTAQGTQGPRAPQHWTPFEDRRLRELAPVCTAKQIGLTIGRSEGSVKYRARKLGISIGPPSKIEDEFDFQISVSRLPAPERQYLFHPDRQWRFDRCWPAWMLAVELEGGTWMRTPGGRSAGHAHPTRFEGDCEKYNAAELLGWTILRFTGKMVTDGRAMKTLQRALREEKRK